MMRLCNGILILGSATPDLETVYRAQQGELALLRLPTRIMGHRVRIMEQSERTGVAARYYPARAEDAVAIDLPPVKIVDMREELKTGNTSIWPTRDHADDALRAPLREPTELAIKGAVGASIVIAAPRRRTCVVG